MKLSTLIVTSERRAFECLTVKLSMVSQRLKLGVVLTTYLQVSK